MALELKDVELRQGSFELRASLSLKPARRYAVIGPSGAGKSTLLALLGGFLSPVEGALFWEGKDITHKGPAERPVAMLFQEGNLFPHLSVLENVALGVHPRLKLSAEARGTVMRAIRQVGLAGMEARKPAQLSGGQQSRAAIARVLVQDRPIILLDEPFAALGPALKAEMLDLVEEIASERDAMILMVSHDPSDAKRIAQGVLVVAEGRVSSPVATQELFASPPQALLDYLGT